MPLDPTLLVLRERRRREEILPLYAMSVAQARAADIAAIRADQAARVPVDVVEDLTVSGADGDLAARLYRPAGEGPFPVVVYFFGGGWALGSLETCDDICRRLCTGTGCAVVSVAYRL